MLHAGLHKPVFLVVRSLQPISTRNIATFAGLVDEVMLGSEGRMEGFFICSHLVSPVSAAGAVLIALYACGLVKVRDRVQSVLPL
jgi:hypothetical protein